MCISEEISWITLILGTIANIYVSQKLYKNKMYLPMFIVFAWQYSLLMQIPDALAWRKIKNGKNTENEGKLAFFLNITQPLVSFLLVLPFVTNYQMLIPILILFGIYIRDIYINRTKYDITPHKECSGLNYHWWEKINPVTYFLLMTLIFIIIPDRRIALLNILLFYGTFIVSSSIKYSCNVGSLWCWFSASCGLINYLVAKRL